MNEYKILGEATLIYLDGRRDCPVVAIIDTEDLDRILNYTYKWYLAVHRRKKAKVSNDRYRVLSQTEKGTISLHRFILDYNGELEVDHINGDSLDCRKSNLRLTNRSENGQNRKSAQANSSTGIRGVFPEYSSTGKIKYVSVIRVKGKKMHVGTFDDIDKANLMVQYARAYCMPFSAERSYIKFEDIPEWIKEKAYKVYGENNLDLWK